MSNVCICARCTIWPDSPRAERTSPADRLDWDEWEERSEISLPPEQTGAAS